MATAVHGKDTLTAYLKCIIVLVNENEDAVSLKFGRPLRLDDFDNLSSDNMIKIVVFLLGHLIGDKEISKITGLTDFNKFGVGNVIYDCAIDHVYHAVRQIFPDGHDLFHYSVLLLPSKDPRRTKAVLSYIMTFVLMCDDLHEKFRECFESVISEIHEKASMCNEIEDLKESAGELIQKKESEKEKLPFFQKELQRLEEEIRKLQNVLARLNEELEKHKVVYVDNEDKVKRLVQELQQTIKEMKYQEDQLVSNPNEIRAENENFNKLFQTETKKRQDIGTTMEKLQKHCDSLNSLISRAKDAIQNFETVISAMESTKLKIETYTKSGNELSSLSRKLDQMRVEDQQLKARLAEKRKEIASKADIHEFQKKRIQDEIAAVHKKREEATFEIKELSRKCNDLVNSMRSIDQEIKVLSSEIVDFVKIIHETIPKYKSDEEASALKHVDLVMDKFGNYPMLPTKSINK